jgi:hypothetical protein
MGKKRKKEKKKGNSSAFEAVFQRFVQIGMCVWDFWVIAAIWSFCLLS